MTNGGKTRFAYRCLHCGETDRITEAEKVWQTSYITPSGPTFEDGCVYETEAETTPAGFPNEFEYDCRGCSTTEKDIEDLAEIVEVPDEDYDVDSGGGE